MRSLIYFVFLKSYVFGNAWKLGFANIKVSNNSVIFEKTKWPQRRRRKPVLISQCQSSEILCHTEVSGLQCEAVTSWVCAQGEIAVVTRYNTFHSVLWQQKIQLSIEQAVSAHFQAVIQSIPSSVQNHIYGKRPRESFREEQREKHHHFPLYYALFESLLLLKDIE